MYRGRMFLTRVTIYAASLMACTDLAGSVPDPIESGAPEPRARYLSITPPSSDSIGGEPLAIRVEIISMERFPSFEGEIRWVGTPADFPLARDPVEGTFKAAPLGCDPVYLDWGSIGVLEVFGSEVVPGSLGPDSLSVYEFRTATVDCVAMGTTACMSTPVQLSSGVLGDTTAPFGGPTDPGFADGSAIADIFSYIPGYQTTKPLAQQAPQLNFPNDPITMLDFRYWVVGFVSLPFPDPPPLACPRPFVGCGDNRVDPPEVCDDGNVVSGDGCDSNCRIENATFTVTLIPVSPTAPLADPYPLGTIIDDEEISLPSGGVRVFFELYVADWDPNLDLTTQLGGLQVTLDASQLTPADRGAMTPATDPCDSFESDCEDKGLGGCVPFGSPDSSCQAGMATSFQVSIFDNSVSSVRFGSDNLFNFNGLSDPGEPLLAGTVAFDVAEDAFGVYELGIRSEYPYTFAYDIDGTGAIPIPIGIAELSGATIVVNTACCGNGVCAPNGGAPCPVGMTPVANCFGDCDGNGVDDACDSRPDCNGNSFPDTCDIDAMTSTDCDGNGVPDECQPDCNNNGIADSCDIADLNSPDCNGNLIPDECDIASGRSGDANADDVPDECGAASRYVTVAPAAPSVAGGTDYALRVKIIDAPQFPGSIGQIRWAGVPQSVTDGALGTINIAQTQCDPTYVDWTVAPDVSLYGTDIVPDAVYEIRSATEACVLTGLETCMSPPGLLATGKWADVRYPWGGAAQPNFADVSALVDAFKHLSSAPSLTHADLVPNLPDQTTNFADISGGVDAFKGAGYPYAGPGPCP